MKYKLLLLACYGITLIRSSAQDLSAHLANTDSEFKHTIASIATGHTTHEDSVNKRKVKFFIGYDLGEAAFNGFQSLGSEVGLKFKNNHILRFSYTNLNLSEKHLSSDFAKAVDGKNVKGKQVGYEVFYDFPVFIDGLYISPSAGYYDHLYTHTVLDESLENSSFTLGGAVSFTETDLFKLEGLYYRFSIPMRFNFNPIEETKLGETTIKSNAFDNSIWFYIGYEF